MEATIGGTFHVMELRQLGDVSLLLMTLCIQSYLMLILLFIAAIVLLFN